MPDPVPSGVPRLKSRTHQVVERGICGALRRFSGLRDQPSTTRRDGVFPTRGVSSVLYTSHMTRTSRPPRIGSGKEATGLRTRSEAWPSAWFVLEPSKPQTGGSAPSVRILVFDRSLAVGLVPSIQMYSALYRMVVLRVGVCASGDQRQVGEDARGGLVTAVVGP